ncbi:tyrosine-type recombinase/integrase [Candidatus Nitrosocosmicus sp. FF01]|uniref:tyrosine-type recombinase/integrase n=1 Tax=Candidatus Nitrosocosmicus sp. FF01 TaxID=3397670 RepID=UPI0039E9FE7F
MSQNLKITSHSSSKDSQVLDQITNMNIEHTNFDLDEITNRRNLKLVLDKINQITKGQKPYLKRIILNILNYSSKNAEDICDFIIAERNEINIKESTIEWHVKVLGQIQRFHNFEEFKDMTREDILNFLNSLRKPSEEDPTNKSIGNRNNKQRVLLKFFKWLHNPETDHRNRPTPSCMNGVKVLPRKELSPYKPSDLWTQRDNDIFIKYCPSKRDRAFHAMAIDTSCRPHELLGLRIKDIQFKVSSNGRQYAEVLVSGKTKSRTVPLLSSLPYIKEWIQDHPIGDNPNSWLFIALSKNNFGSKISLDGLLRHYKDQYRDRYFPKLLGDENISEADKAFIRNLLTKPFTLYVLRHSALTMKSTILKEHVLRDHAGWSMTSKMPQVYIHYFGTESSNSLLKAYGIEKEDNTFNQVTLNLPKPCPNCGESCKKDSKFCLKCKMVLSYDSYNEVRNEDKQKIDRLENQMKSLQEGMNKIFAVIQQNNMLINVKPEILDKWVK